MDEPTRSWIWADQASGGVKGARVERGTGMIDWVDQPGCACGNAVLRQSDADFLARGPAEGAPADVLAEIRLALSIDSATASR